MLERLERAHRAAELTPFLEVGDRHLDAPLGQPELLGREHRRSRGQGGQRGALGPLAGHDLPADGAVQRQVAQLPGHVERDDGRHGDAGISGGDRVQAVRHAGRDGVDHGGDSPAEPVGARGVAVARPADPDRHRRQGAGRGRERHGQRGCRAAGRQADQQFVVTSGNSCCRGNDGTTEIGNGARAPPDFLRDHCRLAVGRAGPAAGFRDEQAGAAEVRRQGLPQAGVIGFGGLRPGDDGGRGGPVRQQCPDGRPQLVLRVAVQQAGQPGLRSGLGARRCLCLLSCLGHRGRSFHGTSLSSRVSCGSPRTRSAMMLRRISEVPPSMEFPRARR